MIHTVRDASVIAPYVAWKRQKGFKVTTQQVSAGTNVKSTIQNAYNASNNLLYVQLVGDWEDLKSDMGTGQNAPMDPMLGCVLGNDNYPDLYYWKIFSAIPRACYHPGQFGSIVFNAMVLMYAESRQTDDLETIQTWTIFGDASLQVRTQKPDGISIRNQSVVSGQAFLTNITQNSGGLVPGAMVFPPTKWNRCLRTHRLQWFYLYQSPIYIRGCHSGRFRGEP